MTIKPEEAKRGRGRPPKSDAETVLTMKLTNLISSRSGLTSAELQKHLLQMADSADDTGAYWNRYKRGDRSMNPSMRHRVYLKAAELGYLPKKRGFINQDENFGYLTEGLSLEEAKSRSLTAKAHDRSALKLVAEARSALRKVCQVLCERDELTWSVLDDEFFECKYMLPSEFKKTDELLGSIRFDSFTVPGDEWLKNV